MKFFFFFKETAVSKGRTTDFDAHLFPFKEKKSRHVSIMATSSWAAKGHTHVPGLRDPGHSQDPVSVLLVGFGYRENRVKLDPQVPYNRRRAGHVQGLELERETAEDAIPQWIREGNGSLAHTPEESSVSHILSFSFPNRR